MLNNAQQDAVAAPLGPLLVLAGAGSGKTRVLVARLERLIRDGAISNQEFLAVTFTNKAASEMRGRLRKSGVLDEGAWIGTFHGLAHRLLRIEHERANLPQHFQIIDADDSLRIIKRLLESLHAPESLEPKMAAQYISRQKEKGLRAHAVPQTFGPDGPMLLEVYRQYEAHCIRQGVVDFSELLLRMLELFKNHPDCLAQYQARWKALFVDEFQDTNHIQYEWLHLLASKHQAITVVGDDDQSIYSWRGAQVENIRRLTKDFKDTRVIRLEQNYRSTNTILKAANALIAHNTDRMGKALWSDQGDGASIVMYAAMNETDEAQFVADKIRALKVPFDEVAILYRSHAQSRVFEQWLARHEIPYQVFGGLRFFDRAEIKDALAYLRLLINPDDDVAFERIVNVPTRGVGDKTLDAIRDRARTYRMGLLRAATEVLEELPLARRKGLELFLELIRELTSQAKLLPLSELVQLTLTRSNLRSMYQKSKSEQQETKLENLEELVTAAYVFSEHLSVNPWDGLVAFLSEVALNTGEVGRGAGVNLMTIHAAKGLEFSNVYLTGLEEGLFPHHRSKDSPSLLEEERRLCYVGMTRAKQQLILSYAMRRAFAGRHEQTLPSRFIREIPMALIQPLVSQSLETRALFTKKGVRASSFEEEDKTGFREGRSVRHAVFGEGTILRQEGSGEHLRLEIRFPCVGTKWLIARLANLEVV